MRWTVHGERVIYDSEWIRLALTDVELPSGKRFEHHVVRMPCDAAGTVVDVAGRGVLLLWRHRFTTDTWGWEIPAGRVDEGETPAAAAERETVEESGWRPGPLELMTTYYPHNGLSDSTFHLFASTSAEHVGDPTDGDEAERVEWVAWPDVLDEMHAGHVGDGLSLTALLWRLAVANPPAAGTLRR
ncbi:MAG: NUDIX hydrolase [Ilumatobacteraceae bacterium]